MPWLAQKSFNLSKSYNPQNATGVQPSAFGGFGTHAPGTTTQSVVSKLHLQRETCTNGLRKTTSMIPLITFILFLVTLGAQEGVALICFHRYFLDVFGLFGTTVEVGSGRFCSFCGAREPHRRRRMPARPVVPTKVSCMARQVR